MLANRISYWLGINGPSYTLDSACSSSLYALENAYRSMLDGQCDAAIVGGANLCLHPYVSLQYSRLGISLVISLYLQLHYRVISNTIVCTSYFIIQ